MNYSRISTGSAWSRWARHALPNDTEIWTCCSTWRGCDWGKYTGVIICSFDSFGYHRRTRCTSPIPLPCTQFLFEIKTLSANQRSLQGISFRYRAHSLSTDFVALSLFGIIHRGDGVASVWGWFSYMACVFYTQQILQDTNTRNRENWWILFLLRPVSRNLPHCSTKSPIKLVVLIVVCLIANILFRTQLQLTLAVDVPAGGCTVDILDYLTRVALELIAQGGLGHSFNSFDRNSKEFTEFQWAITSVL